MDVRWKRLYSLRKLMGSYCPGYRMVVMMKTYGLDHIPLGRGRDENGFLNVYAGQCGVTDGMTHERKR